MTENRTALVFGGRGYFWFVLLTLSSGPAVGTVPPDDRLPERRPLPEGEVFRAVF